MPYISLYRKYRSQTFDDVIGQDHVIRTIKNAINAGRIGQGYLFCGSRGTGKTTVARLIAKALNCLESDGPTPEPCNKCEACLSITSGSAVDVIEMDAASNRGVDDVDSLRDGVKYPPMRLRYKVYIIDEAHQLSAQAKDAFLKTLEEPPPHAVFILATTESGKIPITIRSRCQQFGFRRGTDDEIAGRVRYVVESEGLKIEDDAIEVIARIANGSYRDSLSILEQVIAFTQDTITMRDVYAVAGMVDEDVLLELGEVTSAGDTGAAFALADRLLREGSDVRELLRSAAGHFRDLLALKAGADNLHANDARWLAQAERYSQERLVHIVDVFSGAEKELRWNEQHRLGLEMALLKAMTRPREREAAAEPVRPQHAAREAAEPVPTRQPEPEPARVAAALPDDATRETEPPAHELEPAASTPVAIDTDLPGAADEIAASAPPEPVEPSQNAEPQPAGKEITLGELQRNWAKIMTHMSKVMKGVSEAALAREGHPSSLQGNVLTIGFAQRLAFHMNATQQNAPKIADAIRDLYGVKLSVNATIVAEDGGAAAKPAPGPFEEQKPAEHPQKNAILTMFDGTEVDPGDDPWQ